MTTVSTTSQSSLSTILVLFGGRSSEHEISLRSAIHILQSMPSSYQMLLCGINREGRFFSLSQKFFSKDLMDLTTDHLQDIVLGKVPSLAIFKESSNQESIVLPLRKSQIQSTTCSGLKVLNIECDCVFPVLHGPNGEDGRLQGLLELAELPYVGCDLRASAIGIDKDIQKRLARDAGVHVAKYCLIDSESFLDTQCLDLFLNEVEEKLSYPCFVKPNALGSAVGANKVRNRQELQKAIKNALAFDQKALVEEWLQGSEVECAFLGSTASFQVSIAGEIRTKDFYSYEEKYSSESQAELNIPAQLSPEKMDQLQCLAKKVAKALGLYGLCRIDFWYCPSLDKFIFNEVNTIPGMTSISMFPKLWRYQNIDSCHWIQSSIDLAMRRQDCLNHAQYGIKALSP